MSFCLHVYVLVCVYMCGTCGCGDHIGHMRAFELLRAGVTDIWEPSRERWEPNLSPLQEQLQLLTTNNPLSASPEYCHPGQEEETQTHDAQ